MPYIDNRSAWEGRAASSVARNPWHGRTLADRRRSTVPGGVAVDVQRRETLPVGDGKRPSVGGTNGQGRVLSAQSVTLPAPSARWIGEIPATDPTTPVADLPWLAGLQRVIVLNRDWRSPSRRPCSPRRRPDPSLPWASCSTRRDLTERAVERGLRVRHGRLQLSRGGRRVEVGARARRPIPHRLLRARGRRGGARRMGRGDGDVQRASGTPSVEGRRDMVLFSPACQPKAQAKLW